MPLSLGKPMSSRRRSGCISSLWRTASSPIRGCADDLMSGRFRSMLATRMPQDPKLPTLRMRTGANCGTAFRRVKVPTTPVTGDAELIGRIVTRKREFGRCLRASLDLLPSNHERLDAKVAEGAQSSCSRSRSGWRSRTLPRLFTTIPERCQSLNRRLAVNGVTFAAFAKSSLLT